MLSDYSQDSLKKTKDLYPKLNGTKPWISLISTKLY
jgi:hypothetical protein